ncbi:MAG: hypothetical protein ACOC8E_00915 [Planctomycetota bacterium]
MDLTVRGGSRSALPAFDNALEYIRARPLAVLPRYLVGIAPTALVMLLLIDVMTAERWSDLSGACALLVVAGFWRWGWIAALQRQVQAEMRGTDPLPLRPNLVRILLARLYCSVLLSWGSLLVVPGLYGLFLGGFATPLFLERPGKMAATLGAGLRMISQSVGTLWRATFVLAAAILLAAFNVMVFQYLLTGVVLTSLLGVHTADLLLTMNSTAWWVFIFFLLFTLFDGFWAVASVTLFYHLQAQRLGTDLQLRFQALVAGGGQ